MKHCLVIIALFCALGLRAQETDGLLPQFEKITEADGLSDNGIRHILQLPDGRMIITTNGCFNVLDGKDVQQYSLEGVQPHPLSNYHGSYHVYADKENRLWLKDNGNVWCLNLKTGQTEDMSEWLMDDIFVDGLGRIWTLNDQEHLVKSFNPKNSTSDIHPSSIDIHPSTFNINPEWGELQDVAADSLRMYLFFSTSTVACYDIHNSRLEYTSQPLDSVEAKFYDKTSLVVRSQDGRFYQLRCGEHRNIFLSFNPDTQEWSTVFETKQGNFHTLCIPNPQLALMVCPEGMWEIDLETGEMKLFSEIATQQGDTIRTGYNTVFCDRDGGIWLGSFYDGILYSPSIHPSRSYLIYYIVAAMAVTLLLIIAFFIIYARRMKRREKRLMQRLRKLALGPVTSLPVIKEEEKEQHGVQSDSLSFPEENDFSLEQEPEGEIEVDYGASPFIQRCASLVEQNLNTPGYTVERLAADLCMERTGLYKKLTALLDQTPTLFIRSIRMEQAARMLREEHLSVTEVAERTGFTSAGYFTRLFQRTYGCRPSEYGKDQS